MIKSQFNPSVKPVTGAFAIANESERSGKRINQYAQSNSRQKKLYSGVDFSKVEPGQNAERDISQGRSKRPRDSDLS